MKNFYLHWLTITVFLVTYASSRFTENDAPNQLFKRSNWRDAERSAFVRFHDHQDQALNSTYRGDRLDNADGPCPCVKELGICTKDQDGGLTCLCNACSIIRNTTGWEMPHWRNPDARAERIRKSKEIGMECLLQGSERRAAFEEYRRRREQEDEDPEQDQPVPINQEMRREVVDVGDYHSDPFISRNMEDQVYIADAFHTKASRASSSHSTSRVQRSKRL